MPIADSITPIARNPASFRDPSGFVFEYEGRIFRAVDQACLDLVTELRDSGLLQRLTDAGPMVRTEIVEDPILRDRLLASCPDAAGFLEHERVEWISYPYEWSAGMLADAGIATLDLQMQLLEKGYSLKDATAYNIQFVRGRPVFLDVASIERPARLDVWIALGQFNRMFTLPLLLNQRKGQSLRSYFLANLDGCDVGEVQQAFGRLELLRPDLLLDVTLPYWMGRMARSDNGTAPRRIEKKETSPVGQVLNLKRLRSKLQKIARPRKHRGVWADYTDTCSYTDRARASKTSAVSAFLQEVRPATVLDLGCNSGEYTRLACQAGARVIAADSDPDTVDILFHAVRDRDLPILPMCVDIANPSPAIGFRNAERASFLDRFQVDCVLALALIHHLHVSANLPLKGICQLLADLAGEFLVLEFVPADDVMFRRLMTFRVDLYYDYTLENCIAAFAPRFDLIRRVPVDDSPRTLLLFRRKPMPRKRAAVTSAHRRA